MSDDTTVLADVVAAAIRATPGVVQLYSPRGAVPLVGALGRAVVQSIGAPLPAPVRIVTNDDGTAVSASIGIDATSAAPIVVRQVCAAIRAAILPHAPGVRLRVAVSVASIDA